MIPRSLSFVSVLFLASLPSVMLAQETTGKEDERMETLAARNQKEWLGPRNKVSVGFRLLDSGGKVDFGNLGAIPAKLIAPASAGAVDRIYDNGAVGADALRSNEVDSNGNQTSTPGGRYQITSTGTDGTVSVVGDYVSYTPGQTRSWTENTQDQLDARPGYVGFTNYSTTSEGGHFSDKAGPVMGVELEFSRSFGRVSRRVEWSITTGITLNSISNKTAGVVTSTLNARTDYYAATGPLPPAPTSAPSFVPLYVDGLPINDFGYETTVPISQTPDESLTTNTSTPGGAEVHGQWQVKGAYMMLKLGPSFHVQFSDHWEMTGSIGFAGAYAGTTYSAVETVLVAGLPEGSTAGNQGIEASNATKFLTGYYGDLTFQWTANDTTGIYGGITAQQLTSYEQMVAERTAKIDLGSTVGVRGGISIKF
jgi:hypothetical protein